MVGNRQEAEPSGQSSEQEPTAENILAALAKRQAREELYVTEPIIVAQRNRTGNLDVLGKTLIQVAPKTAIAENKRHDPEAINGFMDSLTPGIPPRREPAYIFDKATFRFSNDILRCGHNTYTKILDPVELANKGAGQNPATPDIETNANPEKTVFAAEQTVVRYFPTEADADLAYTEQLRILANQAEDWNYDPASAWSAPHVGGIVTLYTSQPTDGNISS